MPYLLFQTTTFPEAILDSYASITNKHWLIVWRFPDGIVTYPSFHMMIKLTNNLKGGKLQVRYKLSDILYTDFASPGILNYFFQSAKQEL